MNNKFKLTGIYNYWDKLYTWKKYAERNKVPQSCQKCMKPRIHKTILLETKQHICWFCWIKKGSTYAKAIIKPAHTVYKPRKNIRTVETPIALVAREEIIAEVQRPVEASKKTMTAVKRPTTVKKSTAKNTNDTPYRTRSLFHDDELEDALEAADLSNVDAAYDKEMTKLSKKTFLDNSVFSKDMIDPKIVHIMEGNELYDGESGEKITRKTIVHNYSKTKPINHKQKNKIYGQDQNDNETIKSNQKNKHLVENQVEIDGTKSKQRNKSFIHIEVNIATNRTKNITQKSVDGSFSNTKSIDSNSNTRSIDTNARQNDINTTRQNDINTTRQNDINTNAVESNKKSVDLNAQIDDSNTKPANKFMVFYGSLAKKAKKSVVAIKENTKKSIDTITGSNRTSDDQITDNNNPTITILPKNKNLKNSEAKGIGESTGIIEYFKNNETIKCLNLEKSKKVRISLMIAKFSILLVTMIFGILSIYYSIMWQSLNNSGFLQNIGLIKNGIFNFATVDVGFGPLNLIQALGLNNQQINLLNSLAPNLATLGIHQFSNFSIEMLNTMIIFAVLGLVTSISVIFLKDGTALSLSLMVFALISIIIAIALWSVGLSIESLFTTPFNNINNLFSGWKAGQDVNDALVISINNEIQSLINLFSK